MSIVFINHFAGTPDENDISLRHYFFAKNLKRRNINSTIITSSKSYFSNNKTKITSSKKISMEKTTFLLMKVTLGLLTFLQNF